MGEVGDGRGEAGDGRLEFGLISRGDAEKTVRDSAVSYILSQNFTPAPSCWTPMPTIAPLHAFYGLAPCSRRICTWASGEIASRVCASGARIVSLPDDKDGSASSFVQTPRSARSLRPERAWTHAVAFGMSYIAGRRGRRSEIRRYHTFSAETFLTPHLVGRRSRCQQSRRFMRSVDSRHARAAFVRGRRARLRRESAHLVPAVSLPDDNVGSGVKFCTNAAFGPFASAGVCLDACRRAWHLRGTHLDWRPWDPQFWCDVACPSSHCSVLCAHGQGEETRACAGWQG